MLVKKIPIFKGFQALELVKILSFSPISKSFFLDIETNGLSSRSSFIYLIGAMDFSENSFQITQWIARTPEEEKEILSAFSDYSAGYSGCIHFHGDQFDLPFLQARFAHYGLEYPLSEFPSFDLCKELKKIQNLLKLPNCKYTTAESFLGLSRENDCSGKECIHLYQKYYATQKEEFLEPILEHNQKDLEHLPDLCSLLSYQQILQGSFQLKELRSHEGAVLARLALPFPLPRLFSYYGEHTYLTGEKEELRLQLTPVNGKLKRYFDCPQDYYYLPEEDTAVHKSVGIYVDKARRKRATAKTCYTWFPVTDEFLTDKAQAEHYLQNNLGRLLGFFS